MMETAQATAPQNGNGPIIVELDAASWHAKMDAIEQWLDNVVMVQAGFRQLAEDVRDKLHEPHFRDLVNEIVETAARHEQLAESLYESIGRQRSARRQWSGKITLESAATAILYRTELAEPERTKPEQGEQRWGRAARNASPYAAVVLGAVAVATVGLLLRSPDQTPARRRS